MADDIRAEVRYRTLQILLDKVWDDSYPSSTMLDMCERLLVSPEDIGDYVEVLLAKVKDDTYPSASLINRLIALG